MGPIKYLQEPTATVKGHINQERKNLQSTKNTIHALPQDEFFSPTPDSNPPTHTHNVLATLVPFDEKNMAYSDQTGRFPYITSRGNAYILIIYDYDSNAIMA